MRTQIVGGVVTDRICYVSDGNLVMASESSSKGALAVQGLGKPGELDPCS